MQVNFIQVSYVLGISTIKAKIIMYPFVDRVHPDNKKEETLEAARRINKDDFIESALLKAVFRHPSPVLDGKDKIEYTILRMKEGIQPSLKKKIVEDMSCLKAGKIAGKYRPLLYILNKEDVEAINQMIKTRRSIFLKSGGVFPIRKPIKGL